MLTVLVWLFAFSHIIQHLHLKPVLSCLSILCNFHVHDQVCLLKFVAVTIGVVKSSDKLKQSSASLVVHSFSLLYIHIWSCFVADIFGFICFFIYVF